LVPVDGSETAAGGLEEAIRVVAALGGRLRLVHVVNEIIFDAGPSPGLYGEDLMRSLRENGRTILAGAEALARRAGVEVESVLLESIGLPASGMIVEQSKLWPADLIVMGTHGRRGLARLTMGSDAEQVVRTAVVPVLLVKAGSDFHQGRLPRSGAQSVA
jgi:nucleotide-binding universal stress UspA family protein